MLLEAALSLLTNYSFFSTPYNQSGLMNSSLSYKNEANSPSPYVFRQLLKLTFT